MKAKLRLVLSFSIFLTSFSLWSQQDYWQHRLTTSKSDGFKSGEVTQLFTLNQEAFQNAVASSSKSKTVLWFPDAQGKIRAFEMEERSVMHPDLQAKYPQIRSLVGFSEDGKTRIRLTISPNKLALMIRQQGEKDAFLEMEGEQYRLYARGSHKTEKNFECKTPERDPSELPPQLVDDQTLRTYRFAVSTTGEYTSFHGGTVEGALAAINTTVSRINEVLETDMGVRLELIANNDQLIFTNSTSDPYSNNLNNEVQNTLTTRIGEAAYDVGHLFHRDNDNGNAGGIGTVCQNGIKGAAFSSALTPEGDRYDLDYVAHELGHQFGANHTWSFQTEGTGVQAEPGSGTTIMGYAGITGANDVASFGDDYYHYNSILQMTTYLGTTTCGTETAISNQPPVITEQPDYQIPVGTPFVLEGVASDPDSGDQLTYCWEQIDNGVVTNSIFGPNNTNGASFRSLPPTVEPYRFFPRLSRIVSGDLIQSGPTNGSAWETLANVARVYNFALTVRDNAAGGGQVDADQVRIEVLDSYTPFQVTSQGDSPTYAAGSIQTLQWDTGGTEQGSISATKVDVYFSADQGVSFPILVASGLLNDGEAQIQIPGMATTQGRLMVRPQNQIFLAVNSTDITVTETAALLNVESLELAGCQDSTLDIPFTYEAYGGFSETMTLSATVPSGVTASFSQPTVSATDTALNLELSNLNAVPAGSYTVTLMADGGGESYSVDLNLVLLDSAPGAVELQSPAANATAVSIGTALNWTAISGVDSYEWQIATDAGFSSIVDQGTTSFETISPEGLLGGTQYYWRVRGTSACGAGAYSTVRTFTTATISCDTVVVDTLPVSISSGAPSTEEIQIPVTQNLPISSVAVRVQITHTFVGDLVLRLRSPSGTTVTLLSQSCGGGQNIDALFTDEGTGLSCGGVAPVVSGNVLPQGALSAFAGESSQGVWVLEVEDTANADGGSIEAVSLEYCVEGDFRPDADGDGVFDDGDDLCLGTPPGQEVDINGCAVYRFADNAFQIEVNSESCRSSNDGLIRVVANATVAAFDLNATLTGDNVNQSLDLSSANTFENLSAGTYRLCIDGMDGGNTYEQVCFDLEVTQPDVLQVQSQIEAALSQVFLEMSGAEEYEITLNGNVQTTQASSIRLSLEEGVNVLKVKTDKSCQGEFAKTIVIGQEATVAPNPVGAIGMIYLPQNLTELRTRLYTLSGQLLVDRTLQAEAGLLQYPTAELSSGIYFLTLEAPSYTKTVKIIKP